MKRFLIWSSIVVLVAVVGIVVVRADSLSWRGYGGPGWRHHSPLGYLSHELRLNDEQQSQIKSIWQTERPMVGSLIREFAAESMEMEAATEKGNLDDTRVRAIATHQGETIAKLLVEKQRFKSKVYATVLNQEQRDKADELEKTWQSRLDGIATKIGNGANSDSHN